MKKIILAFIFIALCLLIYTFYSPTKKFTELNLSIPNKLKTLDPALAFDDTSLNVIGQSLDTLYQYHYLKRPYEIIPSLAQDLPQVLDSGKVYIIKIKKNIRYHSDQSFNGNRYVKAQDFILAIKRLFFRPLQSVGGWVFDQKIRGVKQFKNTVGDDLDKMIATPISGLTAIDDFTLKIELLRPDPNFLFYLSMYFTSPIPEELVRHYKNNLSNVLVGTGAFVLREFTKKYYKFERFEHYRYEQYPSVGDRYANTQKLLSSSRQKLPFLDEAVFHVVKNEEDSWNMLIAGKLDIINVPKKYLGEIAKENPSTIKELNSENIEIKFFSRLASRWLGINMQDPLIGKSLELRKAIAHAINMDKYLEIISNNTNLKANSILHPGIKGYRPEHSNSYRYDLNLAKKYLAQAGFPNGEGLPNLTLSTRGKNRASIEEANFFKQQLEKIGINIEIEILSFTKFIQKGRKGELKHLWIDNWIYDYPDAENILQLLISKNTPGINKSGIKNPQIDKLYEKLINTTLESERLSIIYEIEKIVYEEIPWVMIMYESSYILKNKKLKNYRKSYFIKNNLKYLKKLN